MHSPATPGYALVESIDGQALPAVVPCVRTITYVAARHADYPSALKMTNRLLNYESDGSMSTLRRISDAGTICTVAPTNRDPIYIFACLSASAAFELLEKLIECSRPGDGQVSVGAFGLVSGDADTSKDLARTSGCDLARAISDVAPFGTALCGASTFEAVRHSTDTELRFWDVGTGELGNGAWRERLFQVLCPGLLADHASPSSRHQGFQVNRLPRDFGFFLGRHAEQSRILQDIAAHRLVMLVGSGGIGKTHLAIRTAAAALDGELDGAIFVDLNSAKNRQDVLNALGYALGHPLGGNATPTFIRSRIAHRRYLLLLDGIDGSRHELNEIVLELLREPGITLLLTGFQRLNLPMEHIIRISGLSLPPLHATYELEDLEDYEASALFLDRARDAFPQLAEDLDPALIREIVCVLEGHPLAIILAAHSLRDTTLPDILLRLRPPFASLGGGEDSPLENWDPVVMTLGRNFAMLPNGSNRLLGSLSYFRGTFHRRMVAQLAQSFELPLEPQFEILLDSGMVVEYAEEGSEPTYRLPQAVRRHYEKGSSAAERATTARAFGDQFVELLRSSGESAPGLTPTELWADLDFYKGDLLPGIALALENGLGNDEFLDLLVTAYPFLYEHNHTDLGVELIEHAIKVLRNADGVFLSRLHNIAGTFSMKRGEVDKARRFFNTGLSLAKTEAGVLSTAMLKTNLAALTWSEGDPLGARHLFLEAETGFRRLKEPTRLAQSLINSVCAYIEIGELTLGREKFEEAVSLGLAEGDTLDRWCVAMCHAQFAVAEGLPIEATPHLLRCVHLALQMGDRALVSRSLMWLAEAISRTPERSLAMRCLAAANAYGSSSGQPLYRTNELRIARIEGRLAEAARREGVRFERLQGSLNDIEMLLKLIAKL